MHEVRQPAGVTRQQEQLVRNQSHQQPSHQQTGKADEPVDPVCSDDDEVAAAPKYVMVICSVVMEEECDCDNDGE